MARTTSIRLNKRLVNEAAKAIGAKFRPEAVRLALETFIGLKRFKNLMKRNAGKLPFDGFCK